MKREAIESLIIGYLATYLPIFDYSSGRIAGTLGLGILVFMFLAAIEEEQETGWIKTKCLYGLSVLRIKLAEVVAALKECTGICRVKEKPLRRELHNSGRK